MKVLFTGGRNYDNYSSVANFIDTLYLQAVIVGDCPTGLDSNVREYCAIHEIPYTLGVADWATHGKAAGPMRNKWMLDNGLPDVVFAFPGGVGTSDMIRQARKYGCPVFTVNAA